MKYIIFLLFLGFLMISFNSIDSPSTELELGEKLFFDPLLSRDHSISCASCHQPQFAFADTTSFSLGVDGQLGTRNTPSSMNMLSRPYFFYDGRAASIEEQVLMPIHNPIEMDLPIPTLLDRLNNGPYLQWFQTIYGSPADSSNLSMALAAFVSSLESPGDSPFDQWMQGDTLAMSSAQIRGREIFNEKAKCFDCHFGPDFTGDEFRNIGLFNGSDTLGDVGRFAISQDSSDLGKLKVPGLRNIAITAPYMHNGQFTTLEEVVDYYDDPSQFVHGSINRDTLLQEPLHLTVNEKQDLIQFLEALTDRRFQKQ
ncbi:cytochrome-c peroxidase [Aureispira anguillae]|uniref:Cytochrome-c peroxidase n=1 Tax=Aureispira anguillae TaxID=2864201 RepID=A0A916DNL7_9BACT|nr:cytochrome c peroxidase [Aureispira anguillae]BDS09969.1 cytochrome-c peroxidase [Aureispira anguillae]